MALGLVGVGYAVGLVRQLTPRVPVSSQQRLADWLAARHLDNGLAGYWQSAVIAPMSDGSVQVRQVDVDYRLNPRGWSRGVREDWAAGTTRRPRRPTSSVLAPSADSYPGFTDRAAVIATFGQPTATYHFDGYTILVWPGANLLAELAPLPAGVGEQGRRKPRV